MQYVQNTAARCVLQVSKFQHITPVLCELHWLPIQYRIIFKILLLVYKSLNGTSPSYLAQKLHYRSHTRSLRSVSNELLMQPRSYTKTYGDRAFAVHAPREWNLIPYEIGEVQHQFECCWVALVEFSFCFSLVRVLLSWVALVLIFSFFTLCKYNRIWL